MNKTIKLQRLSFDSVFDKKHDGSLTPKRVIKVNGVTIGPGVSFGRGVNINGVDFFKYNKHDIAVEEVDGAFVIKGFYNIK